LEEDRFFVQLKALEVASEGESAEIRELVREMVPTYHSNGEAVEK
jgi:hypothetical protein